MSRKSRSYTLTDLTRTICRCCGFTWMGRNWIHKEDRCLRCNSVFLSVTPLNIPTNHGHKRPEETTNAS